MGLIISKPKQITVKKYTILLKKLIDEIELDQHERIFSGVNFCEKHNISKCFTTVCRMLGFIKIVRYGRCPVYFSNIESRFIKESHGNKVAAGVDKYFYEHRTKGYWEDYCKSKRVKLLNKL